MKPAWITEAEYLATEASSPGKREYVNGEVLAMAGVSLEHSSVQGNLLTGLKNRLRGAPCSPHGPDLRVLGESTESHDRVVKVAHYRHRATVDAIVLVDSRRRLIEIQTRNANGTWTLAELTAGELRIDVLDVGIPFDEIYEGVVFPALSAPPARAARRASRGTASP